MHRVTTADSLVKIIQVLQLGRKTGTLTVERGAGATFEEGMLVFVNGQVADSVTEQHVGLEALHYLNTWGQCRFAFIPQTAETFTSLPLGSLPDTDPSLSANDQSLARFTRPLPATRPLPVPQPLPQQEVLPSTPSLASIIPIHTRSADEALQRIAGARLSRTHKHIFLLIDGHRTVGDLAQLTRHELSKLLPVLDDLVAVGVIQR